MSRHDQLAAPVDACTEGHHLANLHLIPRLQRLYVARVGIGLCVTVTWEVLDTASDACILQSLQVVDHHRGC